MNFRTDSETVGTALEAIAPVFYSTFSESRAIGVTESEAFYLAMTDCSFEYENDSTLFPNIEETFSIWAYVRNAEIDAEIRCLELATLANAAIARIGLGPSQAPVNVKNVSREDLETQSTCLYKITATSKYMEVI